MSHTEFSGNKCNNLWFENHAILGNTIFGNLPDWYLGVR